MKRFSIILILALLALATASAATEQEIVNDSAKILRDFRAMPERGIPRSILNNARSGDHLRVQGRVRY